MLHSLLEEIGHLSPLARFAVALAVFLLVPKACQRVGLPGVVGLLAAGIVLGPNGLAVAPRNPPVADFFAEMGKLLLMFAAGLEINLEQFKRSRDRSIVFGLLTFGIPLTIGLAVARVFGYGWVSALLIGSLLASHTLLGFPIVQRLGLTGREPVAVTVGATIFTDLASLLVLAVCLPVHSVGFSPGPFALQLVELAIYVPIVLFGLAAFAKRFLPRLGRTKEGQFVLVLLIMIVAAEGAELIHLESIIGAFLAGLAVNGAVRDSEAKEELEFLSNTLFIPAFFLTIGFLIDVRVFARTLVDNIGLCAGIVLGLVAAKFAAAAIARRLFGYTRLEGVLMGALSLPQVAATLAAALVAFECTNRAGERLIDQPVVNTVIVLMVVTSILGPVLTERIGRRLAPSGPLATAPRTPAPAGAQG